MTDTRDIRSDLPKPDKAPPPGPPPILRTRDGEPPIKTPNPPDEEVSNPFDEVPKVGSKDSPGG